MSSEYPILIWIETNYLWLTSPISTDLNLFSLPSMNAENPMQEAGLEAAKAAAVKVRPNFVV